MSTCALGNLSYMKSKQAGNNIIELFKKREIYCSIASINPDESFQKVRKMFLLISFYERLGLWVGIIITTVIKAVILPVAFPSELTKQSAGSNACTMKDENSFSSES